MHTYIHTNTYTYSCFKVFLARIQQFPPIFGNVVQWDINSFFTALNTTPVSTFCSIAGSLSTLSYRRQLLNLFKFLLCVKTVSYTHLRAHET